MGLPDSIVRQRPDNMPYAAQIQYEQHPIIGQSMLSAVEQLVEIATWIRHHHERWDGGGYPDRLSGPAIPLPSRLIALADGYLEAVGREGGTAPRWHSEQPGRLIRIWLNSSRTKSERCRPSRIAPKAKFL